ncbi:MAG: hypothetical protein ACK4IC_07970 [Erythrobacter sp.]
MRYARLTAATLLALAAPGSARDSTPGPFHGNWRMVAADDRGDHGLMAITIQLGRREVRGGGDYAMHQPMCSFLDGGEIRGDGECALTGGSFTAVRRVGQRLVLTLAPSADGTIHRLTFGRRGEKLVGTYRTDRLVRAVILEPAP